MENVVLVIKGMHSDYYRQRLYTPYSPCADMALHLDFLDTMPNDLRIFKMVSFISVEIVE